MVLHDSCRDVYGSSAPFLQPYPGPLRCGYYADVGLLHLLRGTRRTLRVPRLRFTRPRCRREARTRTRNPAAGDPEKGSGARLHNLFRRPGPVLRATPFAGWRRVDQKFPIPGRPGVAGREPRRLCTYETWPSQPHRFWSRRLRDPWLWCRIRQLAKLPYYRRLVGDHGTLDVQRVSSGSAQRRGVSALRGGVHCRLHAWLPRPLATVYALDPSTRTSGRQTVRQDSHLRRLPRRLRSDPACPHPLLCPSDPA